MTWGLFLNKSSLEDSAQERFVCLTGKNTIHYQPRHKAKVSSYPSPILSWKKKIYIYIYYSLKMNECQLNFGPFQKEKYQIILQSHQFSEKKKVSFQGTKISRSQPSTWSFGWPHPGNSDPHQDQSLHTWPGEDEFPPKKIPRRGLKVQPGISWQKDICLKPSKIWHFEPKSFDCLGANGLVLNAKGGHFQVPGVSFREV